MESCRNCKAEVRSKYCEECGQKFKENDNRSLSILFSDAISNFLFLDNRLWVSAKYLVFKPGRMSLEFIEGKRRKFLSPIALFLFINLLYFLVDPSSDYHLSLVDQIRLQPYSPLAKDMVVSALESYGMDFAEYRVLYNIKAIQLSKLCMIANVPILALFIYLLTFKIRRFYFDSLIYSFHFFSVFLLTSVTAWGFSKFTGYLGTLELSLPITLIYAVISGKVFFKKKWGISILLGIYIFLSIFFTLFFYRALNFLVTYFLI